MPPKIKTNCSGAELMARLVLVEHLPSYEYLEPMLTAGVQQPTPPRSLHIATDTTWKWNLTPHARQLTWPLQERSRPTKDYVSNKRWRMPEG